MLMLQYTLKLGIKISKHVIIRRKTTIENNTVGIFKAIGKKTPTKIEKKLQIRNNNAIFFN